MGNNGLFDNISPEQIQMILSYQIDSEQIVDVSWIAKCIATLAYRISINNDYVSPFAIKAQANGYLWQGGVSDDITVIVAKID